MIKAVFNKADDWTNEVEDKDTTLYRLRLAVGMRNAATKGLSADADDISVEYTAVLRSGGQEPLVTAEAAVTVPIRYSV